jgi:hypothetical protein
VGDSVVDCVEVEMSEPYATITVSYFIISVTSGLLLSIVNDDGAWFLRMIIWPVYLVMFWWKDLF